MIVSKIGTIGVKNIDVTTKMSSGVGFCYFDPSDELLKEFTEEVVIPVYPGEKTKRQFYIVKDDASLLVNTATFTARSSVEYSVKSSLNYDDTFDEILENNSVLFFFSQYASGIIPVTVYIENKKDTVLDFVLEIEIEVE